MYAFFILHVAIDASAAYNVLCVTKKRTQQREEKAITVALNSGNGHVERTAVCAYTYSRYYFFSLSSSPLSPPFGD